MGNFNFLKSIDKDLYEIAEEAEKLYRDEYFQQCMTQTRRFAESLCKKVLGDRITTEETFDDMLATLKDKASGNPREKEFIDDLYFLKKAGNQSAHAHKVEKNGLEAIECLQRAFEAGLNYAISQKGPQAKLLKLRYDEELLILGEKGKRNSLKEKYLEQEKIYEQEKAKVLKKMEDLERIEKEYFSEDSAPKSQKTKQKQQKPKKQNIKTSKKDITQKQTPKTKQTKSATKQTKKSRNKRKGKKESFLKKLLKTILKGFFIILIFTGLFAAAIYLFYMSLV